MADLHSEIVDTHAVSRPNVLHFHAIFGEISPNNRFSPFVWEILDPLLQGKLQFFSNVTNLFHTDFEQGMDSESQPMLVKVLFMQNTYVINVLRG